MRNRSIKFVAAGLMVMMFMTAGVALKPFFRKTPAAPDNEVLSRIVTTYDAPTARAERNDTAQEDKCEGENCEKQKPKFRFFGFKRKQQLEQKISDELKKPQAAAPERTVSTPAPPAAPAPTTPAPSVAAQPLAPAPAPAPAPSRAA